MVDANESLGMIGLRAVPGVLDVVPVFHPVVVVQIPGARKGMRPSLQTASGGGTCPRKPVRFLRSSIEIPETHQFRGHWPYHTCNNKIVYGIKYGHTASLQMNFLSRNQCLTMMEAFFAYISSLYKNCNTNPSIHPEESHPSGLHLSSMHWDFGLPGLSFAQTEVSIDFKHWTRTSNYT